MKTRRWLLWFCVVFGCGRVFAVVLPEAAVIDGSDVLKITPHEAIWTHRYWSFPGNVRLNDVS